MSKYYLLSSYHVPIFHGNNEFPAQVGLQVSVREKLAFYEQMGVKVKNKPLLKLTSETKIGIVYHNADFGHFLITSADRATAYHVANLIRGFLGVFCGKTPDDSRSDYFLQELNEIPQPIWTESDLLSALKKFNSKNHEFAVRKLFGGNIIFKQELIQMALFLKQIYQQSNIHESLDHLLESRLLFYGYMVGSYLDAYYFIEREKIDDWEMEKRYFENKYRYETAFVAAFKGIERYFNNSFIKKSNISTLFDSVNYEYVTFDTIYERSHEVFLKLPENIKYGDVIKHFLNIRNCTAAHGNKNPPKDFWVSEDNVFEIQRFLKELIWKAYQTSNLSTVKPNQSPEPNKF